ncbi:hypothetical protein CDL12_08263 [Handroanthus impetiginosus]|uniref:Transmembrane protein n=1 Tax=Handroanthus impetiginosus TaxID=429701 RepID=A0A2G9HNP6_9LAMI|nr:hypothetical protein CDL12_08263 [Handroanthus impetiginosus]
MSSIYESPPVPIHPLMHEQDGQKKSWVPSLCSLFYLLGLIWAIRYKIYVICHLEKMLEREKEDSSLLAKCGRVEEEEVEFVLLKEVYALRRAKSSQVYLKPVRKWSARDFVTLFFFIVSCFVLCLTSFI